MNILNYKLSSLNKAFLVMLLSVSSLSMVACSSTSISDSNNKMIKNSQGKKQVEHIHPENICVGTRSHSHIGGEKDHEHSTSCGRSQTGPTNAHIHKAGKFNRSYRHVHPNGSNEHSHH